MFIDTFIDSQNALEIDKVSKRFCKNLRLTRKYGFRDLFLGGHAKSNGMKLRPGEFWAVSNVSFSLNRGETLGIIGLNGSGKSTLLKMINGLFLPDEGEIRIKGRVGALIELGTGFHPMLSGKENVYVKGALLGISKPRMDELYPQIVKFAELGDFINAPFKTYSSGMKVRLGFSVAAHINPDVLLMDEVLAVGDFIFRQKCLEKINMIRANTTTIFVSHAMGDVKTFCDRALVLDKGKIVYDGQPADAVNFYYDQQEKKLPSKKIPPKQNAFYRQLYHNRKKVINVVHEWHFQSKSGKLEIHDTVELHFSFKLLFSPKKLIIGIPVWRTDEQKYIATFPSDFQNTPICQKGSRVNGKLIFKCIFNPGKYTSTFNIKDGPEFLYRNLNDDIEVMPGPRVRGLVTVPHEWFFF